jgi:outer membrane receptor protein involved in Fe transport
MGGPSLRKALGIVWPVVAALLWARALTAQTTVISGRVMTQAQQPLAGASVGIPELGVGTVTSTDGRYTFTVDASRARGQPVNVMVRFLGYKPKRMPITITPGRIEHDFVLERDILQLEQVVVTGTSEATSQKKTPFSVGVVDNTQIKEVPSPSPIGALQGKLPGASVITTYGQPGSEPSIRLRSATSLTGRHPERPRRHQLGRHRARRGHQGSCRQFALRLGRGERGHPDLHQARIQPGRVTDQRDGAK